MIMTQRTLHPILISLAPALLSLAASCHDEPKKSVPGPEPEPEPVGRCVLVYQVANNNGLASKSIDDIEEMQQAAAEGIPGDKGVLLVYNHRNNRAPVLIQVKEDGLDTLKTYSTALTSVDAARMLEVFDDMRAVAPADDYGLILWGHGSGWLQDGTAEAPQHKRSYGGDSGKWMNITTLADVIAEAGRPFSFLYFDCCYMASVEVAYELRHAVPVIAGSVTEIAGEGMPYHRTLDRFFTPGDADIIGAAKATFDYYDEWSAGIKRPECSPQGFSQRYCTMSVILTDGLDRLAEATAKIYSRTPAAYPADMKPQPYGRGSSYRDKYFDFGKYVADLCKDAAGNERYTGAGTDLREFRSAIAACVAQDLAMEFIFGTNTPISEHCGLSTYIMKNADDAQTKNYVTLSWYSDIASQLTF